MKNIKLLAPAVIDGAVRNPVEGVILVDADTARTLIAEKAATAVEEPAKKESVK